MGRLFSHYRPIAIGIWLLAVAASLAWNTIDDVREQDSVAHKTARAFFEQIMAARRWNLVHGGVYVYTAKASPPNPYLPKEQRTIQDNTGRSLTLVNPAYMTRQIAEISNQKGQIQFHITSLEPLRAENSPYPWEIPWLQSFKQGATEQGTFVKEDGKKIFRYMAPLKFVDSCLPCHTASIEKYNTRGAISVSIPIPFHKSLWPLILSHLFAALTGIAFILFFGRRLSESRRAILKSNRQLAREIEERKETERELISIKENLEKIVANRTAELQETNTTLDTRIQEQQRIEAALVSINDEFIQIFNSAPDGMHVIDRNYNVIRVNQAYCQLVGKKLSEIQGHKCYEVFSGKNCHTEECPLTRIINGAERVEVEADKSRANGDIIPCIITATPFREPGGKLTGIIEVTRDISNWKKIENSLSATAANLRLRNAELEDFAHVISHDLQEPLMLIQAFSERIQKKCAKELPQKGQDYLKQIESSTQRMKSLIDGLLLYSRVSSQAVPFENVNLADIINSVLDDLAMKIEKYGASITVDQNMASIEADPVQMRQLFQNIIGNSLKYHHENRKPEISVHQQDFSDKSHNHRYIRICIKDNGIGFDTKYQKKIFDIFQRLHTRQQFQGTGIGLSICKKIVERHRGSIYAEGIPGVGSTFTITLPLHQPTHNEEKTKSNALIDIIISRR
jgi:PAS domain S-box-containing protein